MREFVPGTLAVLTGSALSVVSAFGIRWWMARVLSPEEVGLVMLAAALSVASGGVAGLGLHSALAHRLTARRAATGTGSDADLGGFRLARQGVGLAAMTGLAAAMALFVGAPALAGLFSKPDLAAAIRGAAPAALGLAVGTALLGVARAHGDLVGRVLVREGLGGALRFAGVVFAALEHRGAALVSTGLGVATAVGETIFLCFGLAKGWLGGFPERSRARHDSGAAAKSVAGAGVTAGLVPYVRLAALFQGAQWFDLLLLGLLASPHTVGIYSVARGVGRIFDLASDAAATQFLGSASDQVAQGGNPALDRALRSTRLLVLSIFWPPIALLLAAPGRWLGWVFGADYVDGGPTLAVLASAFFIALLAGYVDRALVASGHAATASRSATRAFAVAVGVALVAIPRWGGLGAALGWASFTLTQAALNALALRRTTGIGLLSADLLRWCAIAMPVPLIVAFLLSKVARLPAASPWILATVATTAVLGAVGAMFVETRRSTPSDR